jgi:hypothetical protein
MKVVATFAADPKTILPALDDKDKWIKWRGENQWAIKDYAHFTIASPNRNAGKRVLIFHGTEDGVLTRESEAVYNEFRDRTDMIYCCYPFRLKRKILDPRIQGMQEIPLAYTLTITANGLFIMTIFEDPRRRRFE